MLTVWFIFFQIHIPNYCVIQKQCTTCVKENPLNADMQINCQFCGQRQFIIRKEGDELMKEFFSEILKMKNARNVFLYAHNASGYDAQFILRYMMEKRGWTPSVILNGGKIMSLKYGNLIFKDTLNLMHSPLAALSKMFGIPDTVKGYFPHFFNTKENQHYVGEIPDIKFYGVNEMKPKQREVSSFV